MAWLMVEAQRARSQVPRVRLEGASLDPAAVRAAAMMVLRWRCPTDSVLRARGRNHGVALAVLDCFSLAGNMRKGGRQQCVL